MKCSAIGGKDATLTASVIQNFLTGVGIEDWGRGTGDGGLGTGDGVGGRSHSLILILFLEF